MSDSLQLKHAYLIMAHNNFGILEKLIKLLDHKNNDIYIHIDLKAEKEFKKSFNVNLYESKVTFIKSIDVKWGHFSQVACELNLLSKALKNKYDYYHLLSGVDLPIKSQKDIQEFFKINNGKEFIHFESKYPSKYSLERIRYYHILQGYLRISRFKKINMLIYYINIFIIKIQKIIGINRNKNNIEIQKGANWFSITHEFAEYVMKNRKWIQKFFKYTANPDELFLQTIVINSDFKSRLYSYTLDDSYKACLRYIDWSRGNPYTWRINDYNELLNSEYLYARKFDENVDEGIINEIFNYLKNNYEMQR